MSKKGAILCDGPGGPARTTALATSQEIIPLSSGTTEAAAGPVNPLSRRPDR